MITFDIFVANRPDKVCNFRELKVIPCHFL